MQPGRRGLMSQVALLTAEVCWDHVSPLQYHRGMKQEKEMSPKWNLTKLTGDGAPSRALGPFRPPRLVGRLPQMVTSTQS